MNSQTILTQSQARGSRMRDRAIFLLCFILLLGFLPAMAHAAGQINERQFRDDLDALSAQVRSIGSPGYELAAEYIQQQIQQLPGVELRRQDYPVMTPVTRQAQLLVAGQPPQTIYPFWPAQVRPNATPVEGLTGRAVYVGKGNFDQIPPDKILGQIAVLEASSGMGWQQAAYFGAKAIIVLGDEQTNNADLQVHELQIPLNIPRFYLPAGPLASQLRNGEIAEPIKLQVAVNWQRKMAHNFYALVLPKGLQQQAQAGLLTQWALQAGGPQGPADWTGSQPPAALAITCSYDTSALVPDLGYGASQAVQTAGALALLRRATEQPLNRPVLVAFTGADSVQFLGMRQLFMSFADVPRMWRQPLEDVVKQLGEAQEDYRRLKELESDPSKLNSDADSRLVGRIVKMIETDTAIELDELFRSRMAREERRDKNRIKVLEAHQSFLSELRYAFLRRPANLSQPQLIEQARYYVKRTEERLNGLDQVEGLIQQYQQRQAELLKRIDLYRWLADRIGRDSDPDSRANNSRLLEMQVAMDLSDQSMRFGPLYWGQFQRSSAISNIQDYRDWFTRQKTLFDDGKSGSQWFAQIAPVLDLEPLNGARSPQSWLCASMPLGSELASAWGVPGLTFATLDDLRLLRDTPNDTRQRLRLENILPQLQALDQLIWKAWNDPRFRGQPEIRWQRNAISGQVVSPAPGRPVPDLPRTGFLAMYYYSYGNIGKVPGITSLPYTMGIRRSEVHDCNAEGYYRFEGLPRTSAEQNRLVVEVYKVTPDTGVIAACTDLGKQAAALTLAVDLNNELDPLRSLVFGCEEFSLSGLYDPRYLQELGEVYPLDSRRNAEPQRYNMMISRRMMAGFIEPNSGAYLIFRYGRVGNRLLLLNMGAPLYGKAKSGEVVARGFNVDQLNDLGPLSLVTAHDFGLLDGQRLEDYRKAGVSSALLDDLHRQANEQIAQARVDQKNNDGVQLIRNSYGAWANEARVYSATQDMANDVIRAAIFLLLLCVPFSFSMERLTIGTPNVYKQIAYTLALFAVMTAALWSFHPAFRISSSPLIIILSFAIILMSVVVISVVYGKFDTELKRIRSGRGSAATTSFARASVLMSAVLLGIANMRKRKFRTALTSITIVLITFAVLCFTSAAQYVGTITLPTGVPTNTAYGYGLMLRQRGWRPMPEVTPDNLRAALADPAKVDRPALPIVERWWNIDAGDPKNQVHVVADGQAGSGPRVYPAQAILGLSPGESRLSPIAQVLGKEKFQRLENGERNIIFLSAPIAEQLGVSEGATVRVGGLALQVASVFDANEFDRRVQTVSGDPIAPLKYVSGGLDSGGRNLADNAVESLSLDSDSTAAELSSSYEHLSSSQYIIVPAAISRLLPNSSLRSVAMSFATEKELTSASDELSRRLAVAMFAGFADGVKMVAASNLASVSGAGQVAIPLAIAGLIIFNTMMGSIAERRREIHVYTSLGLAPMHVGALFVAEALTYGLIGTVFGYVIGQGVGTLLLKLGWLGNVTLNYSGSSAMMTLGLILLVVLLSALVPARLASKIAAPSIDRTWKVPMPKDDRIIALLPFTINKTAADGALGYLAEFFDAHQEGSIGKFSSGKTEAFIFADEEGRKSRGLKTVIWLTPFDLGVRQHLMLLIHPGQFEDIYEVQVVLQRLSGDDGSWWRMNRSFLTELRKQFLQWRSLSPQRMLEYVEESHELFDKTPGELVTITGGEDVRLG